MPIPTKKSNESDNEYISRCVSSISGEYEQQQALAICYSKLREKMSRIEKEELFVLQPRKAENRGNYLSRCSKNNKMKVQYPNLKERMGFCLNSFNAYYKYWSKMEGFAEVPKDSALGECIAREEAKGFTPKEAYGHCASKVVVQPGPIVLSEDNLLVEPVSFGEKISIDFDDTLSTPKGKELAIKLIDEGNDLHIVTRRNKNDSAEVYKVAEEVGIPKENIHFTGGELKYKTLQQIGVDSHIDNNPDELNAIKENTKINAIKFANI